jgi:carbon monoxide dehydrogenase subunit G
MLATKGEVLVACSLDHAWALFNRFDEVASLIPTVKRLERHEDALWATVGVQLGVLSVTSRLMLKVVHIEPWRICAEGWSFLGETLHDQVNRAGPEGIERDAKGKLSIELELEHAPDGTVRVRYSAQVEAFGRLRRIYQSILDNKAPAMMQDFAERLRGALEAPPVEAQP